MMKEYFRELLRYNDWANQRVLITFEEHNITDDRLLSLFSHLLTAQIIWLNRIKGIPTSPFPIWEQYKLRELRTMTMESSTNWINYLEEHQMSTFEEMIFYKNSAGRKYETTIKDIISQVINHSTYHRGQIAGALRERGIDPPGPDYITYVRLK